MRRCPRKCNDRGIRHDALKANRNKTPPLLGEGVFLCAPTINLVRIKRKQPIVHYWAHPLSAELILPYELSSVNNLPQSINAIDKIEYLCYNDCIDLAEVLSVVGL